METASRSRESWHTLAAWALVSVFIVIIVVALPYDMDEFLPYSPLYCQNATPLANSFEAPCGGYPIDFFGLEYQRAFPYIGAATAWLASPVVTLSNSWLVHSLLGVAVLLMASLGVIMSIRLSVKWWPVATLYLPILLPTVHDTGPIRITLLTLTWSPVALALYLRSRAAVQVPIVMGSALAWILAMESKPFFGFLIPGILAWMVAALWCGGQKELLMRNQLKIATFCSVISLAALAVIVTLRVEGRPYFLYLLGFPSPNSLGVNLGTGLTFMADWPFSAQRFLYLYPNVDGNFPAPLQAPLNALPLTDDRGGFVSLILTVASTLTAVALYGWASSRNWHLRGPSVTVTLLATSSLLFTGALLSGGGSVHHFVFAHVPLLAMCLLAFSTVRAGLSRGVVMLGTVSTVSLTAIIVSPVKPEVSPDIVVIMEDAIARARGSGVVNCANWGCFHQFVYRSNGAEPIVFAESATQQRELAGRVQASPKIQTIQHVCRGCDSGDLESAYPDWAVVPIASTPSGWKLFEVTKSFKVSAHRD